MKQLFVLISILLILTGCNGGNRHLHHDQNKSAQSMDNIQDTLGMPAWINPNTTVGTPYMLNQGSCIDAAKFNVTLGTFVTEAHTILKSDDSTTAKEFFNSTAISGGYGLLKASLDFKVSRQTTDSQTSLAVITKTSVTLPAIIYENGSFGDYKNYLQDNYLRVYESNPNRFVSLCGNGFVSSFGVGKYATIVYRIDFGSSSLKQRFEVGAAASYSSSLDLAAKIDQYLTNNNKTLKVSVSATVEGGADIPPIGSLCTSSESFSACVTKVESSVNTYLKNNNQEFQTLRTHFSTPRSFADAEGELGGYKSSHQLGFTPFPRIDLPIRPTSLTLINMQRDLEQMITLSTTLSANGPLMTKLASITLLSPSENFVQDATEIISQAKEISAYNNSIIADDNNTFILDMLAYCYNEDEEACRNFMDNASISGANDIISPKSYLAKLKQMLQLPSFTQPGYYSAVDPNLANFFWFPIYDPKTNKNSYFPITLNHLLDKTGQGCNTEYTSASLGDVIKPLQPHFAEGMQVNGLKYNDWDSGDNIVTKFLPLPTDLYVDIESKGQTINSITRNSETLKSTDISGIQYNRSMSCDKVAHYSYQAKHSVSGFECGDLVNDKHEPIMYNFFRSPDGHNTIADAMLFYGDKPFTTGQINDQLINHVDSNNQCHNIGNSSLSQYQPWCSGDNGYCLVLDPSDNYIKRLDISTFTPQYQKLSDFKFIPNNVYPKIVRLDVSNSDKVPGLYYLDNIETSIIDPSINFGFNFKQIDFFVSKKLGFVNEGYGVRRPVLDQRYYHEMSVFAQTGGQNIGSRETGRKPYSILPLNGKWYSYQSNTEPRKTRYYLTLIQDPNSTSNKLLQLIKLDKKSSSITNSVSIADPNNKIAYAEIGYTSAMSNTSFRMRFFANDNSYVTQLWPITDRNRIGFSVSAFIVNDDGKVLLVPRQVAFTGYYGEYLSFDDVWYDYFTQALYNHDAAIEGTQSFGKDGSHFKNVLDITESLFVENPDGK